VTEPTPETLVALSALWAEARHGTGYLSTADRALHVATGVMRIAPQLVASPLDAITRELMDWQRETFPHGTPASCVAHLVEEVAELSANPTDASEIADCYFLIVGAASRAGIDLVSALREKLAVNRARAWGHPDANGVVNHVREGDSHG
jgi:hypothetical protein